MAAPLVVSVSPAADETSVLAAARPMGRPFRDLTGRRFGSLVVLRQEPRPARWLCQCDCGNEHTTITASLLGGKTTRCLRCAQAAVGRAHRIDDRAFTFVLNACRHTAKTKGLEFSLSPEEFRALIAQDCHYCGEPPSRVIDRLGDRLVVNGLDRMDSGQGYTKDNCVACCTRCNMIKRAMPYLDFVTWVKQVARNLGGH